MAWITVLDDAGDHIITPAWSGTSGKFAEGLPDFREPIARSQLSAVRAMVESRVIRVDDIVDSDLCRQRQPNRVSILEN